MLKKDLVSIGVLSSEDIFEIFKLADELKRKQKEGKEMLLLKGKTLAMIFEKPSLRTRVTFEAGMTQLGGHTIYLAPADIQLGVRESVYDAAKNLERWVDGIMARTFSHKIVKDLAKFSNIPVINGLTNLEHPCQALGDFLTIWEIKKDLNKIKLAFIGDGNNVCNSLMLLSAKVGTHFSVGCSEGYEPDSEIRQNALAYASESGSKIEILNDPVYAARNADFIYTDVWASMGQEEEREKRKKIFAPFQVNTSLLSYASPDVRVMHCLPARRGEEITDEVMDGKHSIIFDQAENRLHSQKSVLVKLLGHKSR